jgi:hypothetical protein
MFEKLKKRIQYSLGLPALADKVDKLSIETRIAAGFSRGASSIASRAIDPHAPQTWEFGAFSQHGEDGILEYLIRNLKSSDKYFLEIAAGDGLENCTAYLALGAKWSGLMVEGDRDLAEHCRRVYQNRIWNVMVHESYVNLDNLEKILSTLPKKDFDLFSLDIDSIDFHILKAAVDLGYRPKILVVEYNSAFGPEHAVSVPYKSVFNRWSEHATGIYYGASIMAWHLLLEPLGYKFVSVDSSGTNAFFANKNHFYSDFLEKIIPVEFLNNATDINPTTISEREGSLSKAFALPDWEKQSSLLSYLPLEVLKS